MNRIPKIDLDTLETVFAQMERRGVRYGLGAKAPSLDCDPADINKIDCSGAARYLLFKATNGALRLPDGSQNQREWCEKMTRLGLLHQIEKYTDAARYMTAKRLFICFIKPFENGCDSVGHVWLLSQFDDGDNGTAAGTLESHGGAGINSRAWNARTLVREFHSCFELPVTG